MYTIDHKMYNLCVKKWSKSGKQLPPKATGELSVDNYRQLTDSFFPNKSESVGFRQLTVKIKATYKTLLIQIKAN